MSRHQEAADSAELKRRIRRLSGRHPLDRRPHANQGQRSRGFRPAPGGPGGRHWPCGHSLRCRSGMDLESLVLDELLASGIAATAGRQRSGRPRTKRQRPNHPPERQVGGIDGPR